MFLKFDPSKWKRNIILFPFLIFSLGYFALVVISIFAPKNDEAWGWFMFGSLILLVYLALAWFLIAIIYHLILYYVLFVWKNKSQKK